MSRKKKKNRRSASGMRLPILLLAVIVLAAVLWYTDYKNTCMSPVDPDDTSYVSFSVPAGASTTTIGSLLEDEGLIHSKSFFKSYSKKMGLSGKYQAGDFKLSPSMDLTAITQALLSAKGDTADFTIPEGYDIRRTTEKLAAEGLIDPAEFADQIENGDFDHWFMSELPRGKDRLEGFLFPETYQVFSDATEGEIIEKMLSQFDKVYTEEYRERAEEMGLSLNEVITMASIIEREAMVNADRPVIAGVFYNRLEAGMLLQSCATVQYILGEQKPVLSTKDTQIDDPYNTYIYEGLPPGPICSPGEASIRAALYPEDNDYLYFLAKGDGSHVFAKTYEEHLKNKAKYIDN